VPAVLVVLPALSLIVHFGVCLIVAAGWRAAGFDVDDIFRQPWRSRSLAEFWSRRWNVGFSEMLAVTVSRPLAPRLGRPASVIVAFLASGLLHELAISVPAGGGYGLPTLYFAIHGALVAAGARGRAVTLLAVILPLPLLFHLPFLRAIVIPLLR
jgi:alginate O-acetyltransferase complex protein AlgI